MARPSGLGMSEDTPDSAPKPAPPAGTQYEMRIDARMGQAVSLSVYEWIPRLVAQVGSLVRVVAPLMRGPGRPREYDHDALTRVAEDCAKVAHLEDHLDRFMERVRHECSLLHIKAPVDSQLTKICKPVFLAYKKRREIISDH